MTSSLRKHHETSCALSTQLITDKATLGIAFSSNILITEDNSIRVIDLGEVQILNKLNTISSRSFTEAYAAPERTLGKSSFESDAW